MRILYVEDNEVNQALVGRVVRARKCSVVFRDEGESALEVLADDPGIDLVLLDIELAGSFSGLDVIRTMRARNDQRPVVAITAYAMMGDRERILAAGCNDYLPKPVVVTDLLTVLDHYQDALAAKPAAAAGAPAAQTVPAPAAPAEVSAPAAAVTPAPAAPTSAAPAVSASSNGGTAPASTAPASTAPASAAPAPEAAAPEAAAPEVPVSEPAATPAPVAAAPVVAAAVPSPAAVEPLAPAPAGEPVGGAAPAHPEGDAVP